MSKTAQIDGPSKNPGDAQNADLGQPASANPSPAAGSTTRRNLLQIGAGLAAISSVRRGSEPAIAAEPINVPKSRCRRRADSSRTSPSSFPSPLYHVGPSPPRHCGGRAEIISSGIFHVLPHKEEVAVHLEPGAGETITYKKEGSNWIVVSGIKGQNIFYRKSILSCHDTIWNDVSIEYPVTEKEKYEPLVAHVTASLREGRGYDWVTKCD